jgi:hypothetical protein
LPLGALDYTPYLVVSRVAQATVTALVTVGFPCDDEPTVNCQDELTVMATRSI